MGISITNWNLTCCDWQSARKAKRAVTALHPVPIYLPDPQLGYAAAVRRLGEIANMQNSHKRPAGSIANAIYIWSPPEDRNNTEGMIRDITAATGLNRNTQYNSLTPAQQNAFVHAYAKREGYRPR